MQGRSDLKAKVEVTSPILSLKSPEMIILEKL